MRMFVTVLLSWMLLGASFSWAVPPSAQRLLPVTTKGYLSFPDFRQFRERWDGTQLGKLAADPIMRPFAERLQQQIRDRLIDSVYNVEIEWQELMGICGGELCFATIQPGNDPNLHASVILMDISGHREEAQVLVERTASQLDAKGGKRTEQEIQGQKVVVYQLPRQRGQVESDLVVYILTDDLLVVGNEQQVCEEILRRYQVGGGGDHLGGTEAFQRVMERVSQDAGELVADLQWYIEPFGYVQAVRASRGGLKKRRKDMLAIFKAQGFEAIQAIGGWVHVTTGRHDFLHRTFVYGPGAADGDSRFRLAARMLEFPNLAPWQWSEWIPRELGTAMMVRWKLREAFEYSSTLVDAIAGDENFFEDVLASIKDDPGGPQVDIREGFVAHLGENLTVISDHVFPITPQSDRLMVAVQVTNEKAVRTTVEQALLTDPDAQKHDVEGHTVWEIIDSPEVDGYDVPLEIVADDTIEVPFEEEGDAPVLPNLLVTVAHGHFIVSTHLDFLRCVLKPRDADDRLSESEDVRWVNAELERVGAGNDCARYFIRTDEAYRPTYELIRQGRMPESESLFGRILNRLLGPEDQDILREQAIDGSTLPDFEAVRRYLGPAGAFVRSEPEGWFITGVLLDKHAPLAAKSGISSATVGFTGKPLTE